MAYLQKTEQEKNQQQIAIGKHNRESLLADPHNDNVLYALAHKKPLHKLPGESNENSEEKVVKKRGPAGKSVVD